MNPNEIDEAIRITESAAPRVLPPQWQRLPQYMGGIAYTTPYNVCIVILRCEKHGGGWWKHVSVSENNRIPTWSLVKHVKETFIGMGEKAIMVLPKSDEYVNDNPNVLHLFSPMGFDPLPDFRRGGSL